MKRINVSILADRIANINEHRVALGRPVFGPDLSLADVCFHERLIDTHAPYGQDPWAFGDVTEREGDEAEREGAEHLAYLAACR